MCVRWYPKIFPYKTCVEFYATTAFQTSELTMAARRRRLVLHHSVPLLSRLSAISLFSHAFHEGSACYGVRGLPFFPEK